MMMGMWGSINWMWEKTVRGIYESDGFLSAWRGDQMIDTITGITGYLGVQFAINFLFAP